MRIKAAKRAVAIVFGLAGALSFAARPAAQGSPYGTLIGVVTDAAGAAVEKAEVEVVGPSLIGGPHRIQTDRDGSYRIWTLPAGLYSVTARLRGFKEGRLVGSVL